jgi:hypothetical protein
VACLLAAIAAVVVLVALTPVLWLGPRDRPEPPAVAWALAAFLAACWLVLAAVLVADRIRASRRTRRGG